ncbi:MAG: class II aldolase/adducin family protein [Clostridiales Family XIII bacterium]|jgi:L-fuculose-phosphate aldolase|nr:class II aldolase/adducin family protein [Clostridiales Family XIII bacterium]
MLESIKKQVLEVAVEAESCGLCMHKSGNFSMMDRESGCMVISPSGLNRRSLTIDDFPVLSQDGHIVEAGARGKPSIEYLMHLKAYQCREDILSIVHTHSHYATAFATLGMAIEPVVFEALFYGKNTEIAPCGIPGSEELAESIMAPLRKADVCLLKNHGVLVVGDEDMEGTLLKAQYVEDVAKVYHLMLTIGGKPELI